MTMNNTLSKIIIFTAGAAIGSVVTWKLVEAKYEQIAREEIESVKDLYFGEKREKSSEEDDEYEEPDPDEYAQILKDAGYIDHAANETKKLKEEEDATMEPYVISPEEFDEIGYETVSLYYFKDGVVTNAISNKVIDNVEELIGDDFAEHFGEYEDDSVFIRNDYLETDYEILKDDRRFSEVN